METKQKPGFITILTKMSREEGIRSLYAGLSASLMRQGTIVIF